MLINPSKYQFDFDYEIVYHRHYRRWSRSIVHTDVETPFGNLRVMISRRYKSYKIHGQFSKTKVWFIYPRTYKRMNGVNNAINHLASEYWKTIYLELTNLKLPFIPLTEFFRELDYFVVKGKINKLKLKSVMRMVDTDFECNRYHLLTSIASVFSDGINNDDQELLRVYENAIMDYPNLFQYKPTRDLMNFKYFETDRLDMYYKDYYSLSYEDFLETIADLSDEQVMELVSNYKLLNEHDEKKDIRYVLFRTVQKFHE